MALLCAAQFVVVLDATIVAVALPAIGRDLGLSGPTPAWVLSAYALVFGGFLMLIGRAADLLGRRRVLLAGFALFGAASLACGLATAPWLLIAARVVQGLGPPRSSPAALALLTAGTSRRAAPARARSAPGPRPRPGGGALGWVPAARSPTGPAGRGCSSSTSRRARSRSSSRLRLLPAEPRPRAARRRSTSRARSRPPPASRCSCSASRAPSRPAPGHPSAWGSLAASAALLLAFARIERRAADPLLPPGTLRRPAAGRAGCSPRWPSPRRAPGSLFLCVLYLQDEQGLAGDGDRAAVRARSTSP